MGAIYGESNESNILIIPAEYYKVLYFSLLSVLVAFSCLRLVFRSRYIQLSDAESRGFSIIALLFTIIYFGLRDPWASSLYLGDTHSYTRYFEDLRKFGAVTTAKDPGFYFFMRLFAAFVNVTVFYVVCAFVYIYPQYLISKKIAPKYYYYAFAFFITSFSFYGFGTNGLRNGLATSIFLLALYHKPKTWRIILLFAIGYTFHSSLALPIIAFLISKYFRATRWLIGFWLVMIPVSYFLGQNINTIAENILFFSEDRFDTLYSEQFREEVIQGFRVDFIIYSAIPIAVGAFFIYKKKFKDAFYTRIFNTYLIANAVWLLLIFAAYTNRIAYLSWFLIPIIIMYPLIRVPTWKNQTHIIAGALVVNLLLTLLLTL